MIKLAIGIAKPIESYDDGFIFHRILRASRYEGGVCDKCIVL